MPWQARAEDFRPIAHHSTRPCRASQWPIRSAGWTVRGPDVPPPVRMPVSRRDVGPTRARSNVRWPKPAVGPNAAMGLASPRILMSPQSRCLPSARSGPGQLHLSKENDRGTAHTRPAGGDAYPHDGRLEPRCQNAATRPGAHADLATASVAASGHGRSHTAIQTRSRMDQPSGGQTPSLSTVKRWSESMLAPPDPVPACPDASG